MSRSVSHEYVITSDIKDLNELQDQLIALNFGITGVIKIDNQIKVRSQSELTVEQKTSVESLMTNFVDSDPELNIPAILSISKAVNKHFHAINYKNELTQSLIPKRTVVKGEITSVTHFKELDQNNTPTTPILRVDIDYTRDATGFAISRQTTRTWFNINGTENPEKKITNKYYFVNGSDQIQEGIKRRRLLVENIQIPVLGLVMEAMMPTGSSQTECLLMGRSFMDEYELEFNRFIENSSTITDSNSSDFGMKSIRVKIRDEANPSHTIWMDKTPASLGNTTTIRQFLMEEFNI